MDPLTDKEALIISYAWSRLRDLDKDGFSRAINYITSRYESEWAREAEKAARVPMQAVKETD